MTILEVLELDHKMSHNFHVGLLECLLLGYFLSDPSMMREAQATWRGPVNGLG